MLRQLRVSSALLLVTTLATSSLAAQSKTFFSVAAGATMPSGSKDSDDYGAYAKTGWMGMVAVGTAVGKGNAFVQLNAFMGKNKHEAPDDGSTTLTGGGASVGISSSGSGMRFYGMVGGGLMQHKYNPADDAECDDCSDSKPYLSGAVGVRFGTKSKSLFVQGGMTTRISEDEGEGTTKFMSLMAGIRFGF